MFSFLKSSLGRRRESFPGVPVTLETLDARVRIVEAAIARLEPRYASDGRVGLEARLASLGRAVAQERAAK